MNAATRQLTRRPGALWRYFTDRRAPMLPKLALLFAAAYVVWPIDAIPDIAPVISWLDDLGVVTLAIGWLTKSVLDFDPPATAAELPDFRPDSPPA
jgi:uncharacterized membrane protein YkvA (DUF1232 family)